MVNDEIPNGAMSEDTTPAPQKDPNTAASPGSDSSGRCTSESGCNEKNTQDHTPSLEDQCKQIVHEAYSGINDQLKDLENQISSLSKVVQQSVALCKESIDYNQRYQRNTVAVLQDENKKKDKLISGLLLIDVLKPIAEICAKLERRIRRSEGKAEKHFLEDILEEITDIAREEYEVEIHRTPSGQPRPENISKVDDTIATCDESLKGKVAESLCSSWVLNGKLIQKERVIVYRYDPSLSENKDSSDNTEEMKSAHQEADNVEEMTHASQETDKIEEMVHTPQEAANIEETIPAPQETDNIEEMVHTPQETANTEETIPAPQETDNIEGMVHTPQEDVATEDTELVHPEIGLPPKSAAQDTTVCSSNEAILKSEGSESNGSEETLDDPPTICNNETIINQDEETMH